MRGFHPIRVMAFLLVLGLSNTARALWSPEPTDNPDLAPLSAAAHPTSEDPKVVVGYTPPLDVQKMDRAVEEREKDPLIRRLSAGRAVEAIEIPLFGKDEIPGGSTFTRVDPAKALKGQKSATSASATDIPIPDPSTYWLMLFTPIALFIARGRFCTRS